MRTKQAGYIPIGWIVLALVILGMLAGIALGVKSYNKAIAKAERLEHENHRLEEERKEIEEVNKRNLEQMAVLEEEKKKLSELNARRKRRANVAVEQERKTNERLDAVRTQEASWADEPVPTSILNSLRDYTAVPSNPKRDSKGQSAEGVSSITIFSRMAGEDDKLGPAKDGVNLQEPSR